MFADALPPPTYCFDWYLLPWPASVIVPLAVSAALVTFFLLMARRVRVGWKLVILASCIILFLLANYIVYNIGINVPAWRPRTPLPPIRESDGTR